MLVTTTKGEATPQAIDPSKVLVVDDEADIREALKGLLEAALNDVQVTTAPSGPHALRLLQKQRFQLILTDFKMPTMNGVEFLAQARTRNPDARCILITAFESELAAAIGAKAGNTPVFTKPLDPRTLLKACQDLLAEASAAS